MPWSLPSFFFDFLQGLHQDFFIIKLIWVFDIKVIFVKIIYWCNFLILLQNDFSSFSVSLIWLFLGLAESMLTDIVTFKSERDSAMKTSF
jgi:hypothetical protein